MSRLNKKLPGEYQSSRTIDRLSSGYRRRRRSVVLIEVRDPFISASWREWGLSLETAASAAQADWEKLLLIRKIRQIAVTSDQPRRMKAMQIIVANRLQCDLATGSCTPFLNDSHDISSISSYTQHGTI